MRILITGQRRSGISFFANKIKDSLNSNQFNYSLEKIVNPNRVIELEFNLQRNLNVIVDLPMEYLNQVNNIRIYDYIIILGFFDDNSKTIMDDTLQENNIKHDFIQNTMETHHNDFISIMSRISDIISERI
jgi:hypothetical protein